MSYQGGMGQTPSQSGVDSAFESTFEYPFPIDNVFDSAFNHPFPLPFDFPFPTDNTFFELPFPTDNAFFDFPFPTDNALERSASPDFSFDIDAAIAGVSDPYRKAFLDLAPEIRSEIYRQLFKGQLIIIRGKDFVIKGKKKEKMMRYERDRSIGLNMMLVSKTCLVEVKAAALSVGVFDVNFTSMLKQGFPTYLRNQMQFGRPELALLRTITIPGFPRALDGLVKQLSNMSVLHDVVCVGKFSALFCLDRLEKRVKLSLS